MRSSLIKLTNRRSIFITLILVTNLLLPACSWSTYRCTDPLGCLEIPSGSSIVIGTILATNGMMGSIGNATLQAIQDTIANRMLLGHPITLDNQATECTPESAQTAATRLALDTNVLAVIGPTCNEEAPITQPILNDAGIIQFSPVPDARSARPLTELIISTVVRVAIQKPDGSLIIPRQAFQDALPPVP